MCVIKVRSNWIITIDNLIGFWYPEVIGGEFASMSFAKVVFKKFFDLFNNLQNEYDTKVLPNGFTDITVDGAIKAKFFKTGQFHDVELLQ